jgi:hypothetical protein
MILSLSGLPLNPLICFLKLLHLFLPLYIFLVLLIPLFELFISHKAPSERPLAKATWGVRSLGRGRLNFGFLELSLSGALVLRRPPSLLRLWLNSW